MSFSLESMIPYDKIKEDAGQVLLLADKLGQVVLLKDNKPAYIIVRYDSSDGFNGSLNVRNVENHTLQEAMTIVLKDAENKTMHAAKLADEIYNRGLYLKKDGSKAQYNQIRARCTHYPNLFEAMPGNYIRLKAGENQ